MFTFFFLAVTSCAFAMPNPETTEATAPTATRVLKKDCTNGIFSPMCLKIGAISLLEKLNSRDEVALIPGVSLVKEERDPKAVAVAAELARSMSEPDARLDKFLLYHIGTFLDTHSVKLRLIDDSAVEDARTMISEGRAKNPLSMGGKKGGMGGLIAMAMMMKDQRFAASVVAGKTFLRPRTLQSVRNVRFQQNK